MHLDFGVAWRYLPILLQASVMTIALFVLSQVLGTLAAFFVALARMSPRAWLRRPAVAYIWVVRGTPLTPAAQSVYLSTMPVSFPQEACMAQSKESRQKARPAAAVRPVGAVEGQRIVIIRDGKFVRPPRRKGGR